MAIEDIIGYIFSGHIQSILGKQCPIPFEHLAVSFAPLFIIPIKKSLPFPLHIR